MTVLGVASERAKSLFKTSHISVHQVAVSCVSGAKPVALEMGDAIVVECKQ